MKLDRKKDYVFLLRTRSGADFIARRVWTGARWKTERLYSPILAGEGVWVVILGDGPFWRGGPSMVLEVPR